MPGSEPADPSLPGPGPGEGDGDDDAGREPVRALDDLEASLDRLLEAYAALKERVERAEEARRSLADALAGAGPEELTPEEAERRFRELREENRRLHDVVEKSRERAERIRSRLIMMEDEL